MIFRINQVNTLDDKEKNILHVVFSSGKTHLNTIAFGQESFKLKKLSTLHIKRNHSNFDSVTHNVCVPAVFSFERWLCFLTRK